MNLLNQVGFACRQGSAWQNRVDQLVLGETFGLRGRLQVLIGDAVGELSGELGPRAQGEYIPANIQVNVGEPSAPKMTHEQLGERIRDLYHLARKASKPDPIM